jgi:hypothetical protein
MNRDWHGRIVIDDLTGMKFGHWTVIRFDDESPKERKIYRWICRCDCGKEKSVASLGLKNGRSKSCGCGVGRITCTTHGLTRTYIHRLWDGMKSRCFNPNNRDYHHYGGRGINVCQGIMKSPQVILDIIGERPHAKMAIDRVDNNGHYSCGLCPMCVHYNWPMNLRWATWIEQANNRRPSTRVY